MKGYDDSRAAPTEDQALDIAQAFYRTAEQVALGNGEQAADVLDDYFADSTNETALLWMIVCSAAAVTMDLLRQLFDLPVGGVSMSWCAQVVGPGPFRGPAQQAAVQMVTAALNENWPAVTDVRAAHYAVAGNEGVFDVLVELASIAAAVIRHGRDNGRLT